MMFTQKLQNVSIEKMNDAGGKRHYVRSFAKRAKSLDLKYTFWEVPSILTITRHRQTQTLMSIVEQNSQNVTTIDDVKRHRSQLFNNDLKGQRATDIDAL